MDQITAKPSRALGPNGIYTVHIKHLRPLVISLLGHQSNLSRKLNKKLQTYNSMNVRSSMNVANSTTLIQFPLKNSSLAQFLNPALNIDCLIYSWVLNQRWFRLTANPWRYCTFHRRSFPQGLLSDSVGAATYKTNVPERLTRNPTKRRGGQQAETQFRAA